MSVPRPEPSLVIHYSYLWRDEAAIGLEEGRKDRPCAIVAISTRGDVLVVPITHREPMSIDAGLEIPAAIKRMLGMDQQRSWVLISESNIFPWPGPDLRPVPNHGARRFAYGVLPPRYFAELRRRRLIADGAGRSLRVRRSE